MKYLDRRLIINLARPYDAHSMLDWVKALMFGADLRKTVQKNMAQKGASMTFEQAIETYHDSNGQDRANAPHYEFKAMPTEGGRHAQAATFEDDDEDDEVIIHPQGDIDHNLAVILNSFTAE
jgi:hypothetical protein